MIRKIVKYGDPVLETPCDPVTEFDTPELRQLIADMFETMRDATGVGLAAPQTGLSQRLTVIDCSAGEDEDEKLVLINPEITSTEGEQIGEEGCLSVPGFREQVKRALKATARAQNVKGEWFEVAGHRTSPAPAVFFTEDDYEADIFTVGFLGGAVVSPFRITLDYGRGEAGFIPRLDR